MKRHPNTPDHSEEEQAMDDSLAESPNSNSKNKGCDTHTADNKSEKTKKLRPIGINLTNCHYKSVRRAVQASGFKEEVGEWTVCWMDSYASEKRLMNMKRFQIINRFPGMNEICRKDLLASNINRLFTLFPEEYNIFPRTWCLPADYEDFVTYKCAKYGVPFICKPGQGCQGKGIFLSRSGSGIKRDDNMICQQYIAKPFLIDGLKFDLRIYVLVTSCDPLRIFIYNEGIVRFATVSYSEPSYTNVDNVRMHLTNYSINKDSLTYIRDDVKGSKRKLSTLKSWLEDHEYDTVKLWSDIDDVIIKTLISIQPTLKQKYRSCFPSYTAGSSSFEIIGFDIILDEDLKPWLLEVNHSPSFTTDSGLDREVKDALLKDTLNMISFRARGKKSAVEEECRVKELLKKQNLPIEARQEQLMNTRTAWLKKVEEYEDSHLGDYRKIYPSDNAEQYGKFFIAKDPPFKVTTTSKARAECVRQKMEEFRLQQQPWRIRAGMKTGANKDAIQGEPARGKPVPTPRRLSTCPASTLIRSTETKPRFTRPLAACQETESVSVLPLPKSRSRDTPPNASAHPAARHNSNRDLPHLPSLLQSGKGAPPSSPYSAGRPARERVVRNTRATAATSETVSRPTRDSQRSLSSANNKTGQKDTSGISLGSLRSSAHGGRRPDTLRSGYLPAVPGNRSLVAASASAPVTRRAQHSRQQTAGVASENRKRR